jgi:hypothetical protein
MLVEQPMHNDELADITLDEQAQEFLFGKSRPMKTTNLLKSPPVSQSPTPLQGRERWVEKTYSAVIMTNAH